MKHRGDYRFIHHPLTFIIRRSPPPQQAGVLHRDEKNVRPATKRKHRRNRPTDKHLPRRSPRRLLHRNEKGDAKLAWCKTSVVRYGLLAFRPNLLLDPPNVPAAEGFDFAT